MATLLFAVIALVAAGALAQDAMTKSNPKIEPEAMSMQQWKAYIARNKKDGMAKNDSAKRTDTMCTDMMKKDSTMMNNDGTMKKDGAMMNSDGIMKKDSVPGDPTKK